MANRKACALARCSRRGLLGVVYTGSSPVVHLGSHHAIKPSLANLPSPADPWPVVRPVRRDHLSRRKGIRPHPGFATMRSTSWTGYTGTSISLIRSQRPRSIPTSSPNRLTTAPTTKPSRERCFGFDGRTPFKLADQSQANETIDEEAQDFEDDSLTACLGSHPTQA